MAKSLRSSIKKGNKARLRSRVFGPVEDARTERLSAKLLELAASAKPVASTESTMDIDKTGEHVFGSYIIRMYTNIHRLATEGEKQLTSEEKQVPTDGWWS